MPNSESQIRLLLVYRDPGVRHELRTVALETFPSAEVFEADDGESGLASALKLYPDVLVVEDQLPGLGGRALIELLHREPLLGDLPCVLIEDQGPELASTMRRNATTLLSKPFSMREFAEALRSAARPAKPPQTRSGIKGRLEYFALPDVLIMTSQNMQTGLLEIEDESGDQRFKFIFERGRVAAVTGPGDVEGLKAFYRAVRITGGSFRFTPWPSFERQPWHHSIEVGGVLLNATQELDELPLVLDELGEGPFALQNEGDSSDLAGFDVAKPLCDGATRIATTQQLLDASSQLDLDAAKQLLQLVKDGLIRRA